MLLAATAGAAGASGTALLQNSSMGRPSAPKMRNSPRQPHDNSSSGDRMRPARFPAGKPREQDGYSYSRAYPSQHHIPVGIPCHASHNPWRMRKAPGTA